MRAMMVLAAAAALVALAGCDDKKGESATASASAAAAAPAAEKAADKTDEAKPSTGDMGASKVAKPLAEWQKEDIEEALKKGGWKVNGSTATKSAMLSIVVNAEKDGTKAKISYYKDGGSFWKKRLEKDGAAIHEENENLIVGVVIKDDEKAAKQLLDSLVGA